MAKDISKPAHSPHRLNLASLPLLRCLVLHFFPVLFCFSFATVKLVVLLSKDVSTFASKIVYKVIQIVWFGVGLEELGVQINENIKFNMTFLWLRHAIFKGI